MYCAKINVNDAIMYYTSQSREYDLYVIALVPSVLTFASEIRSVVKARDRLLRSGISRDVFAPRFYFVTQMLRLVHFKAHLYKWQNAARKHREKVYDEFARHSFVYANA